MTHQHSTISKHDHCAHANVAFCAHCNATYCKDCPKEWSDCTLNHWPTYTPPVYIQPVQPIFPRWQPYVAPPFWGSGQTISISDHSLMRQNTAIGSVQSAVSIGQSAGGNS